MTNAKGILGIRSHVQQARDREGLIAKVKVHIWVREEHFITEKLRAKGYE